ncbi:Spore coat assembly protein ExsA [Sporotomaculum syntrophicum]|uniref:Spore coat assembly protein ExsA n=1 Tax=Sporotomaculum syntrophicum TaxID=182264 RepID=A0A9D2WQN0_9FIRM|nr:LysM peptidoglycan-binding domain-containing protein [Sporotomaculum syntrophicum]KAF1085308.1 Spore coat assembly protein ExsA [Sporotomaculum syntrophicum]
MTYRVQAGDTLFTIAKKFSVTLDNLIAANPQVNNPELIQPGQLIYIPKQAQDTTQNHSGGGNNEPGIPGQKALHVVDVTWDDKKSQDSNIIPVRTTLTVRFDKNVVNDIVWENNRRSISLLSNERNIPIHVTRVRDNVDFSMRNNIFVQPTRPLTPGTTYTLKISPDMISKAGVTLGSSTGGKGFTIKLRTES